MSYFNQKGFAHWVIPVVVTLVVGLVGVRTLMAIHADTPTPQAQNCTLTSKLVPSCGALWGYYPSGGKIDGYTSMTAKVDRPFNLVKWYEGLGSDFPTTDQINLAKTSPTVTVLHYAIQTKNISGNASGTQPAGQASCTNNKGQTFNATGWTYQQINNGSMDGWLQHIATKIAALDQPVMIDFQHEVDGSSTFGACNPTGVAVGTGFAYKNSTPADFVAAYRHIHDVMSAIAPKIVWAQIYAGWGGDLDRYKNTYVGDNYADWVGWDPYNHPDSPSGSRTPAQTFTGAPFYKWLTSGQISSGIAAKPRMLGEYGSNSNASPNRQTWMTEIPVGMQAAGLKAVEYFDTQGWSAFSGDRAAEAGFRTAGFDPAIYANFSYNTVSPAIASVTPSLGSSSGGQTVRIITTNLPVGPLTVNFGGTPANHIARSGSTLTVLTPAHAAGVVEVSVQAGGSTATAANGYTYQTPPRKTGVDLVITDITTAPRSIQDGQAVTFSAVVKNQGTVAVPAGTTFGASFSVDGTKVSWSTGTSSGLAPGASTTIRANTGPTSGVGTWRAAEGEHTILASVNNQQVVKEADAANDTLSTTLNVAPATPLVAPKDLHITHNTSNQVSLAWKAASGGKGITYALYRNDKQIAHPASTSYTDSTVSPATTYTYKVTASDTANRSASSKSLTVQTKISGCSIWQFWRWGWGAGGPTYCVQ